MPTWPGHTGVLVGHRNGQHWAGLEGIKMSFGEKGQTAKQTLPASTDRKYPRGESTRCGEGMAGIWMRKGRADSGLLLFAAKIEYPKLGMIQQPLGPWGGGGGGLVAMATCGRSVWKSLHS